MANLNFFLHIVGDVDSMSVQDVLNVIPKMFGPSSNSPATSRGSSVPMWSDLSCAPTRPHPRSSMHREASDGAGSNSRNKVAKNVAWLGQGWVCWIVYAYKGLFFNGKRDTWWFWPGIGGSLCSETIMMGEFLGNEWSWKIQELIAIYEDEQTNN